MKTVPHGDRGHPDLLRPRHRELDRLTRGQLPQRIAGIDDDRAAAIADNLAGAQARHRALGDAIDIHGKQHHAV
jgi:hypothetical protein